MAKVTYEPLENLESESSAVQVINSNFQHISDAFDLTVFRDGTVPNYMLAPIDMNGQRIMNLGAPASGSDAARLVDIQAVTLTGYAVPNLSGNAGKFLATDGSTLFWVTGGTGDMLKANNLSDVVNIASARNNLGLGSASTYSIGTSGSSVPLLNNNNVWSGTNAFTASVSLNGNVTLGGTAELRLSSTPTTLNDDSAGYRGAPQNVQDNNYTLVLADAGRGITHTSATAHTWTIPPNSSVPFPIHTTIVLDNYGAGNVVIQRGAGVSLRANGSGTSSDQNLPQYYVKTLYNIGADYWVYN